MNKSAAYTDSVLQCESKQIAGWFCSKYVQLSKNVVLILHNDVLTETMTYKLQNFLTLRGSTSLFTAKNLHMAFVQLHNPATLPQTYNKTNKIHWLGYGT